MMTRRRKRRGTTKAAEKIISNMLWTSVSNDAFRTVNVSHISSNLMRELYVDI